jgi:hypothetical protein
MVLARDGQMLIYANKDATVSHGSYSVTACRFYVISPANVQLQVAQNWHHEVEL